MSDRKTKQRVSVLDDQMVTSRNSEKIESRRKFLKTAGLSAVALGLGVPFLSRRLNFFSDNEQEGQDKEKVSVKKKDRLFVEKSQTKKFEKQEKTKEIEQNTADLYEKQTTDVTDVDYGGIDERKIKEIRENLANLYQNSVDEEVELSLKNEKIIFNIDEKTKNWLKKSGKLGELEKVDRVYKLRIKEISQKRKVPEEIVKAVITVESGGDSKAVSSDGQDEGLMQIRKGTQRHLGLKDPFHPYKNIDAGAKYLRQLYEQFGSWDLAVAAYNRGPGGLERMLKKNKDPRKLDYVKRVLALAGHIE